MIAVGTYDKFGFFAFFGTNENFKGDKAEIAYRLLL